MPLSDEIAQEIWAISFPGETPDGSSLTDLFHHAARWNPDALGRLLRQRLCVDPAQLPEFYARWFSVPWKRAWTLNVDDIEQAAARRFDLPRPIDSISALVDPFSPARLSTRALAFIHLNGSIEDGIEHVTFSTTQYGDRLASHDPWYEKFVDDLVSHPFVIVGTRLEEAPFWQNLHAAFGPEVHQPMEVCEAYIVSPSLTRARRALLEDIGIEWIPTSAEAFAREVLEPPIALAREAPGAPRTLH
ncbi:MAG: SIR2 family protein [Myxococcaceae bacterium]|nr:SIR2 family protein [Myxococcaceae bacterium]